MPSNAVLPPGQHEAAGFHRFGLFNFATRFPQRVDRIEFSVLGEVAQTLAVTKELQSLPRVEQVSDFHCVTSWSCRNLNWSGYRFADFYREIVVPQARPAADARLVIFRGEDGYAATMPLDDLLAADVLLADRLDGHDLGIEHGAPLRLVAPAHYGYKSVKHIAAIEFRHSEYRFRFPKPWPSFMHHPRARVALEERGRGVPAVVLRLVYAPLIPFTRWLFAFAQRRHQRG